MDPRLDIIYEDRELLVVNKPAGLVCHPTKGDVYSSLISRARLHLGETAHPQLINRLDRETSGLILVAKDSESARALRRLWEARQVQKEYWAIVHGHVEPAHLVVDAPLGKDTSSRVAIKDGVVENGAPARTEVWVEKCFVASVGSSPAVPFSFLRVAPQTGRKHQIRIHLAHIGHPLVGEKMYGGEEDLYLALVEDRLTPEQRGRLILPHHALHARELRFMWHGAEQAFRAPAEPWFVEFAQLSNDT